MSSTYKNLPDVIKEIHNWLRLATFLHKPLKDSLLYVLHSNNSQVNGLPSHPSKLYQQLKLHHSSTINGLKKKGILSHQQYLKIFPPNKTETDSSTFDITLIVFLIRNCTSVQPPNGGWSIVSPSNSDQSIGANVIRAREWRNYLQHANPLKIDGIILQTKWQEGVAIIQALGYVYDDQELFNKSLDPKNTTVLSSLNTYLGVLRGSVNDLQNDNKATNQALDNVLNEQEDLKELVEKLQQEMTVIKTIKTKQIELEAGDDVLQEALVIVANMIEGEWKALSLKLNFTIEEIQEVEQQFHSNSCAEKLLQCFRLRNNKIASQTLFKGLNMLQRQDIVDEVKKKTFISNRLLDASLRLKERYINELVNWLIEQPLRENGRREFLSFSREDSYVDLSILEASELDHLWSNTDRDYHLKQQHFERVSIKMENVLTFSDRFVIVRGIAGIGKSTFVDRFVLKWAKSQILTDTSSNYPEIKFLFKLTCRDLNTTFQSFHTIEDLLKLKFPNVFQKGLSLADLEELSHQVLVLVDGIDELKELSMFNNSSIEGTPRGAVIQDLLWSRASNLFGHKTIVCGRPDACQDLLSYYSPFLPIKVVEICGFSDNSVRQFVKSFHRDEAEVILQKIKECENLNIMASIPVYLWVICHILTDNAITGSVNTTTELCAYSMLLFVRNHVKSIRNLDRMPLIELCEDEEILSMVTALARLSYITWKDKKVVFYENDVEAALKDRRIKLEETGFITKHLYGEMKGYMYQFKHLVLQEFFCALWCFLRYDYTDERILPIISGLFSIENQHKQQQQCSYLLGRFVLKLREHMETKQNWNALKYLFQTRNFEKVLSDKIVASIFQAGQIVITPKQTVVLSSIYEYQHENIVQRILTEAKQREIIISDITFQHDIRNTVYLLHILQVKSIKQLTIGNVINHRLSDNLSSLCQLFFAAQDNLVTQKIVEISGGDQMRIYTKESTNEAASSTTKQINIEFNVEENIDTHLQFLTELLQHVDKIVLHFSIGRLFTDVKTLLESLQSTHGDMIIEVRQIPNYNNNLSIIKRNSLKETEFNILCDENNFTYRNLSQYLNLRDSQVTDDNISAVIRFFPERHVAMGQLGHLSIDATKKLSYSLTNIRSIELNNCGLTGEQITIISQHIVLVEHVVLNYNHVGTSSLCAIYDALKQNNQLKRLYLKRCGLRSNSLSILLKIFQLVKYLDLSQNKLSPIDESTITDQVNCGNFQEHGKIKTMKLSCCDLADEDVGILVPFLMNIRAVILSGNTRLTSRSTSCFRDHFLDVGENINLKQLDLSSCSFTMEKAYDELLPCLQYLNRFDYRSSITPHQMAQTSRQILQRKTPLQSLDLSIISLTDEHLLNLSPCVKNVEILYVGGAFILSTHTLKALCSSRDSSLKTLDLTGCTLDEEIIIQVLPKLVRNITNLSLGRMTTFTANFTRKLAAELYPSKRNFLDTLSLKNCKLTESTILPLVPCLPYIKEIILEKNGVSHKLFEQIVGYIGNAVSKNDPFTAFTTLKVNDFIVKLRGEQLVFRYL